MRVKDLMATSVTCVRPDTSVMQVAKQMKQENIGSVPVCNDRGEALGIITDRDIVIRSVSDENNPKTAKDIMTTNLIYANPNMDTHEAALLLAKYQVRRLPVVENNKIVGMLAMADIARKPIYVDEAGDALSAISKPSTIS
ncbi:CBS domain-containing protein [Sinanaerobacter chloroacetimidivorans]|jgi:CBS domain-containing protein|uniref:CBS domain-containing protein n=1 Tax=Sinanaerobacter chloroacetimidivorans TaxID=2818044 RepID=A0A8J7W4M1_9FIRM|nr:CBS domain-containing protein [Sinanaerobacter chloroacetimidivorans]MBR0600246.1 CBS domain-containing protein [Sinanaerobacter chloroacetimidivorans]